MCYVVMKHAKLLEGERRPGNPLFRRWPSFNSCQGPGGLAQVSPVDTSSDINVRSVNPTLQRYPVVVTCGKFSLHPTRALYLGR